MKIEKGQLYYVPFPFEDKPGFKPRPAVVLSVDPQNKVFLAAKVTSHAGRNFFRYDYPLQDWKAAGLDFPSTARCDKVQVLPFSSIDQNIGLIGTLSYQDFIRVRDNFNSFNHTIQHMINLPNQVITERYNQEKYASISKNGIFQDIKNSTLIDNMKKEGLNFCYLKKGNAYKCVIDKADIQRFQNLLNNLPSPKLCR